MLIIDVRRRKKRMLKMKNVAVLLMELRARAQGDGPIDQRKNRKTKKILTLCFFETLDSCSTRKIDAIRLSIPNKTTHNS
jgi:hypothetical protein